MWCRRTLNYIFFVLRIFFINDDLERGRKRQKYCRRQFGYIDLFLETPDRISRNIENVQISNLESFGQYIFALWFAFTRIGCDDGYCWRLALLFFGRTVGWFNLKTLGKKAVQQLQLDVSSVAIATTMQYTSHSHIRQFKSERKRVREVDLAAAAIQLSLIILRLSHTHTSLSIQRKSRAISTIT